jgi:hypothetical protein
MSNARAGDDRMELEKALRKSRRALPINVAFAALGVGVLWAAHQLAGLPTWAAYTLGFFAVFGALGDAINIPYVRHRLRRLDAEKRPSGR